MNVLLAVCLGFLLDLCLGDPHFMPHPVRLMGWYITRAEKALRPFATTDRRAFWCGALLSVSLVLWSFLLPSLMLFIAFRIHPAAGVLLSAFMCYQALAARALRDESMRVYDALEKNDLPEARHRLSWIVGRDTDALDEKDIARAAVETVAENLSDGVIAPMLFLLIGGAPLGFAYKAVNTLDSMIGYKNEKYLFFGRFAARMDDVCNFIPARISAFLMIAAAALCKKSPSGALRIYLRDRKNHKSPNSAQTESACAGALGILLGGGASYKGVWVDKPTLGDNLRPITPWDIADANRLMLTASALSLFIFGLMRLFFVL